MSGAVSLSKFISKTEDGTHSLNLLVEGMHCPSCIAIIEGALKQCPEVQSARLNLSTKRLNIVWNGATEFGNRWIDLINGMGYRAAPFDPATMETQERKEEKFLLRCLGVAGFASGNLMLFSVPLWSSDMKEMGEATRTFFHWVQAIIAFPAITYCGLPFYRSAWKALRLWHTNMDVPISVAVILATLMSLYETATFGRHSYFDSAVMLLFFLLIGRYLEARARGKARGAAQDLLQMMSGSATVLHANGRQETIPLSEIAEGMSLMVAAGEKIGADGIVISGVSELDTSLITGETLPHAVMQGDRVFAGTINLSQPLTVQVTKSHDHSLIAEIVKLMETAEQSQARYVTLADHISGWYTPAVHALAAATFIGWWFSGGAVWQVALMYAATVLIITCPCALGLAVPVVQVLATGRLMRTGILLKSGSALERLAEITCAVFDKTGTLTLGKPELLSISLPIFSPSSVEMKERDALRLAASMAAQSKHPLSRAIQRAYGVEVPPLSSREVQGCGLEAELDGKRIRLGKRDWAVTHWDTGRQEEEDALLELWLTVDGAAPIRFAFSDKPRQDSAEVIASLKAQGVQIMLLSGDRREITRTLAERLGIEIWEGALDPMRKTEKIAALQAGGQRVLMIGDGLNDAPSLAVATVSMSPASAMDITQNAADIIFQGELLQPVLTAWCTAKFSQTLVKQNFALAILYNVIAIPLAVAGLVTPLIAAIAMSSSSLLVIANAMRLNLLKTDRI